MLETLLNSSVELLQSLPWWGIILFAFFITFIENIFPPSPSDVLLVFIGTLIGIGTIGFIPVAISATLGGTAGFMVMYYLGYRLDNKIENSRIVKFISKDALLKAEQWFAKWGYYLIVANRFLSGTRAVISFFAGMSKLDLAKTTILSTISAFVWNSILLFAGMKLGEHWRDFESTMQTYGTGFLIVTAVIVVALLIRYFLKKSKQQS